MLIMQTRPFLSLLLLCAAGLLFTACGPDYPDCENDEHCKEQKEFCLNGKCAQCRETAHCKGSCQQCAPSGKCERITGCCASNNDCSSGQVCRDSQCGNECDANHPCPAGKMCDANRCVPEPQCSATKPCPIGQTCNAKGMCEGIPLCEYVPVYFDFDQHQVRKDQKQNISTNSNCMADRTTKLNQEATVTLVGHADEMGPEDYNVELGRKRAEAVLKETVKVGIAKNRLSTDSRGKYEPVVRCGCKEERNRRVEFKAAR
jgi:peptidoglycan-associated lipoprotein